MCFSRASWLSAHARWTNLRTEASFPVSFCLPPPFWERRAKQLIDVDVVLPDRGGGPSRHGGRASLPSEGGDEDGNGDEEDGLARGLGEELWCGR